MLKIKKILAVLLAVSMLMSLFTALGFSANATDYQGTTVQASQLLTGDHFEYGTYPQSKVTDSELIAALEAIECEMISYGYYRETFNDPGYQHPDVKMYYADIVYNGEAYRKVKVDQYRPNADSMEARIDYSFMDDNGYFVNNTYYFKWEPIVWRVLSAGRNQNVYAMSELLLDSQEYYTYWSPITWENSTLRAWLNSTFYNAAFSDREKAAIVETTNKNEGCVETGTDGGNDTTDNLWLLTYTETKNPDYGFTEWTEGLGSNDPAKCAIGSDYAKCQGLYVTPEDELNGGYTGYSEWWLRTAGKYQDDAYIVQAWGSPYFAAGWVNQTHYGVRPAMIIDSKTVFSTSDSKIYRIDDGLCSHDNTVTVGEKEATCTVDGYTGDTYCDDCGKVIWTGETVTAAGHNYVELISNQYLRQSATCASPAIYYKSCSVCGLKSRDTFEVGVALGHSYQDTVVQPTCTAQGYTRHYCPRCRTSYNDNYTPATGHNFINTAGEQYMKTPATCTTAAVYYKHCSVCGATSAETFVSGSPLGHNYVSTVTLPTCKNDGYTTYTCTRCGNSYIADIVTATGSHSYEGWVSTADKHWRECKDCGEIADEAAHTESEWITDFHATVDAEGSKHTACTVCGRYIQTAVIPKLEPQTPNYDTPQIVIDEVNSGVGKTVDVKITFKNNPGITSAKLKVMFPDDLTLESVAFGDIGGQSLTSPTLASPLIINWFNGLSNLETSEFVFATLTFKVSDSALAGKKDITFEYNSNDIYNVSDVNVAFDKVNGAVNVITHKPGDINGDGKVNNKDLTRLFQYLSDWDVEIDRDALDVNGDGKVNNKDLTRLFQYLSDWDVTIY